MSSVILWTNIRAWFCFCIIVACGKAVRGRVWLRNETYSACSMYHVPVVQAASVGDLLFMCQIYIEQKQRNAFGLCILATNESDGGGCVRVCVHKYIRPDFYGITVMLARRYCLFYDIRKW